MTAEPGAPEPGAPEPGAAATVAASPAKVLVRQQDATLIITINRPESRNAIDLETALAIAAALEELDGRDDLAVGLITGAGSAFCAGMDLKAFLRGERPSVDGRGFAGIVRQPPSKPLIAAVEGPAMGGGFEIVLACDLVVAGEKAVFGLPEVKRGLVASGGGLLRLQQRIPLNLATEWTLTGAPISAATAYEVHLVNRLVPAGTAVDAALELAATIAANAPLAVRASKRIMRESRDWPAESAFERQAPIAEVVRSSEDAREGARAFGEKRAPAWRGK
jgi:enoyl-CoA hydratase